MKNYVKSLMIAAMTVTSPALNAADFAPMTSTEMTADPEDPKKPGLFKRIMKKLKKNPAKLKGAKQNAKKRYARNGLGRLIHGNGTKLKSDMKKKRHTKKRKYKLSSYDRPDNTFVVTAAIIRQNQGR